MSKRRTIYGELISVHTFSKDTRHFYVCTLSYTENYALHDKSNRALGQGGLSGPKRSPKPPLSF